MGRVGADTVRQLLIAAPFRSVSNTVGQTRQQIKAHMFWVGQVIALRVSVQQGSGLTPVLVRGIDLKALWIRVACRAALTPSAGLATQMIGQDLMGEREDAFWV
jgi:hypothetical protein